MRALDARRLNFLNLQTDTALVKQRQEFEKQDLTRPVVGRSVSPVAIQRIKKAKKESDSNLIFAVFLVLAAVGLFFLANRSESPRGAERVEQDVSELSSLQRAQIVDAAVNRHLLTTNKKIEIAQDSARVRNDLLIPKVGQSILTEERSLQVDEDFPVDLSPDRNELNAARDLRRVQELNRSSPREQIHEQMANLEMTAKYQQAYREEYAKQFVENARRGGYEIELDENLIVTKVRRISPQEPGFSLEAVQGSSRGSH